MSLAKALCIGVVVGVPVAVTLHDTVGTPATVQGSSMRPTFNPKPNTRDVVWLNRWRGRHCDILPGQVVALRAPTNPSNFMIKRVVATSGQLMCTRSYKTRYVLVPRGHVWVEGDNPRTSKDSNLFGPVSEGLVEGVVSHVVWPPGRWGRVQHTLLPSQLERTQQEFINAEN